MPNDIDTRARQLLEHEDLAAQERERLDGEKREASRLEDARKRIKAHDAEREAERDRREAAAEADELADELAELGGELQEHAEALLHLIEDYDEMRARLMDARRRSGRPVGGHESRTKVLLENWHRGIFGGHSSLVGVPSENAGRIAASMVEPGDLSERDPLAASRTRGRGRAS